MTTTFLLHGAWRNHCALAAVFLVAIPSFAQEETKSEPKPVTTADSEISVDRLKVLLRPLTKEELQVELDAWIALLQEKIRAVGNAELELKDQPKPTDPDAPPTEIVTQLKEQLVELRAEEGGVTERANVVLNAMERKGGDVAAARTYLKTVAGVGGVTDATSYWAFIKAWMKRPDGGMLWLKRFLAAGVILLVFWIMSRFAGRAVERALNRRARLSNLLKNFARRTAGGVVMAIGALMALNTLGVQIAPLLAALGAGSFILAFALQETLGNFASGLMIMIYRPFDVDDYVTVAEVSGTVKEMSLVSTTLVTVDNKVLVIPNKKAWGDTITNFSGQHKRRVDLVFGIGYSDEIQKAIDVLEELASNHELVLDDPELVVRVSELADSSVNLICRPWVETADYWTVYWDLTRQVKERFDAEGISIPFPQRDVHVYQEAAQT